MWLIMGGMMIRTFGVDNFEKFMLSIKDDFLETKRGPIHSASCSIPCLKVGTLVK